MTMRVLLFLQVQHTLLLLLLFLVIVPCRCFCTNGFSTSSSSSSSLYSTTITRIPQTTEETEVRTEPPPNNVGWYSTKIQQDFDYTSLVKSLYVRHIVVESYDFALDVLERLKTNRDSFPSLVQQVSTCKYTATNDGGSDGDGIVGWIDVKDINTKSDSMVVDIVLPRDVLVSFVERKPKPGDIYPIKSTKTNQTHIVECLELYIPNIPTVQKLDPSAAVGSTKSITTTTTTATTAVGEHNGVNALVKRNKLKGIGFLPSITYSSFFDSTYSIKTNGCQMNVADSERLEGILQHQLNMTRAVVEKDADVVIFNTCSIRENAESKLYDALGKYRVQKQQGKQLALIVTGCVAQQEGLDLIRKCPEIDVVLGPQYVPYLSTILQQIEYGHQLVVTAPTLIPELSTSSTTATTATTSQTPAPAFSDDFSIRPVRGHTVRAWVNVIYGCNEHCTYCV
jgi:tRNA-2-methylthio-N6-dimethylallyladenosine synthase